jgi:8-oxo-dGTP pyrophosphatase MutT (NUDIX family)
MNMNYLFQYCQKIVLFDETFSRVLLARRKGEADYDGVYSFIGGKLEVSDGGLAAGLKREKDEEIGNKALVTVYTDITKNEYYIKNDGSAMVLPHYIAVYKGGEIELLASEYSDYQWVDVDKLSTFSPVVETVEPVTQWALGLKDALAASRTIDI